MTIPGYSNTGSEKAERYTPAWLVELIRDTMGGIDLDPCSNRVAQDVVRAKKWFGPGSPWYEDGLGHNWEGRVLVNYPGGRGAHGEWLHMFLNEDVSGVFVGFNLQKLPEAVGMLRAQGRKYPVLLSKKRVHFWKEIPTERGAPYGHTYLIIRGDMKLFRFLSDFEVLYV